ncbi:hypothetical protein SEUCBS139899_008980 [Sporothrix eucalyptigena]|uniref:Cupin type-2 domain-containing protein n=1 Tax=Sporothrix eucalyptigena TaxID=1812306 RepID=A0ABP0CJ93_9PEZI
MNSIKTVFTGRKSRTPSPDTTTRTANRRAGSHSPNHHQHDGPRQQNFHTVGGSPGCPRKVAQQAQAAAATAAAPPPAPVSAHPAATSDPRVVITTHARDYTSVFAADKTVPLFHPFGPQGSSFAVFDVRGNVPVNNRDPTLDFANTLPRCPPGGVNFCITNINPGGAAPMHRTLSTDYCVVLSGEIVLKLDGGEETLLRPGDYVVNGGVNHSWINKGTEVCRIACVMVSAEKIVLADGTELGETVFKK